MKKTMMAAIAALFLAPALAADILVWTTGVRMRVRETLDDIDRAQPIAAVTLLDAHGRPAPVWIRPRDLDWEKTLAANAEGGVGPTLGDIALTAERLSEKPAASDYTPSGDVAVYGVKGKMLYGDRLVSGILRNETSDTLIHLRVRAVCLDRRGKVVASGWGDVKSKALVPGQETPFEVIVRGEGLRYVEEHRIEVVYDVFRKD